MSITKEDLRNWRTAKIAEYARLENEINIQTHDLVADPVRNGFIKEATLLNEKIKDAEGRYLKNIRAAQEQQTGIKLNLVETWGTNEEKTFECDTGSATLRTTKSLNIRSKEKLIELLTKINKLPDFIKAFDITKLRKIMDAGLLESDIATYDEKKSIAIKITEAEQ